jgi:hypothetical protein
MNMSRALSDEICEVITSIPWLSSTDISMLRVLLARRGTHTLMQAFSFATVSATFGHVHVLHLSGGDAGTAGPAGGTAGTPPQPRGTSGIIAAVKEEEEEEEASPLAAAGGGRASTCFPSMAAFSSRALMYLIASPIKATLSVCQNR